MKKIKTNLPIILYAILLLIVCILCVVILKDNNPIANADTPSDVTNNNNDNNVNIPDKKPSLPSSDTNKNDTPFEYNDTIPRERIDSTEYSYIQRIYGDNKISMKSLHQTSLGLYCIISTDCVKGDFYSENPCLGIAKIKEDGSIESIIKLPDCNTADYIASAITPYGLVIVSQNKNGAFSCVNVYSLIDSSFDTYKIGRTETATIRATSDSFIVFAEFDNESVIYKFTGSDFSFAGLGTGKIVDIFDFGNHYTIFLTNPISKSHSVINIDSNTVTITLLKTFSDGELISVTPYSNSYLAIIIKNGFVGAKTLSMDFEKISEKRLGNFTIKAYCAARPTLLLCSGNVSGIISVDDNLITKIKNVPQLNGISKIFSTNVVNNQLYFACSDATGNLCFVCLDEDGIKINRYDITASTADFAITSDGRVLLFYQNDKQIEITELK